MRVAVVCRVAPACCRSGASSRNLVRVRVRVRVEQEPGQGQGQDQGRAGTWFGSGSGLGSSRNLTLTLTRFLLDAPLRQQAGATRQTTATLTLTRSLP